MTNTAAWALRLGTRGRLFSRRSWVDGDERVYLNGTGERVRSHVAR